MALIARRRQRSTRSKLIRYLCFAGIVLLAVLLWICYSIRMVARPLIHHVLTNIDSSISNKHLRRSSSVLEDKKGPTKPISRDPGVVVTTDVRGNLGPPSVMVQDPPGSDWIKDRWQAASDMHGTAIKGVHWVVLEFPHQVTHISRVVLDWEAAYSRDYKLEASSDNNGPWRTLFDSHVDSDRRTSEESGQSPGVKNKKVPLHIIHTITMESPSSRSGAEKEIPFKYFRVWIRNSAMGWGVSLWQIDIYGTGESK